jgi:transposase
MTDMPRHLDDKIADLDKEIDQRANADAVCRRLMTIPDIGPIAATALVALAPPAETFRRGGDFAAWIGLTPVRRSTGGKTRLGRTSKMGERTLRRLLIIGSSSCVLAASKRGAPAGSWLEGMMVRKPRMLTVVANANKMARIVWALLTREEDYKAPVPAMAQRQVGSEASEDIGGAKEGMAQRSGRPGRKNQGLAKRYPGAQS